MAVAGAPCLLLGQCRSHCASCVPVLCGQCVRTAHTSTGGSGYCCAQVKPAVTLCVLDPCTTGGPFACAGKGRCICAGLPAAASTRPPTTQLLCNLRQLHVWRQALRPCNSTIQSNDASGPHRTNNQPLPLAPATSGAHASTAQHTAAAHRDEEALVDVFRP